jgi:hypothetical protein
LKIVRDYINEKFSEDSDPIRDMSIGLIHQIKEYLKQIHGTDDFTQIRRGPLTGVNAAIATIVVNDKNVEWVEYLLNLPEANLKECEIKHFVLQWAAYNNSIKMIKLLLDHGADIDSPKGDATSSSISNAVYSSAFDALKYLIERGALVNLKHVKYAAGLNNIKAEKILLSAFNKRNE